MLTKFQSIALALFISVTAFAQEIHIPDPVFYNALISNAFDGQGGSTVLNPTAVQIQNQVFSLSEAQQVKVINIDKVVGIENFNGVNQFSELTHLTLTRMKVRTALVLNGLSKLKDVRCFDNKISSISGLVSCGNNNPKLTHLVCNHNRLRSLDLEGQNLLEVLKCNNNRLVGLEISTLGSLVSLECQTQFQRSFYELDASNLTALEVLNCQNIEKLKKLNVDGCSELVNLNTRKCDLDSLDVSDCLKLKTLNCSQNNITELDLSNLLTVQNPPLEKLYCNNNLIGGFADQGEANTCGENRARWDLRGFTKLKKFHCDTNQLEHVDVRGTKLKPVAGRTRAANKEEILVCTGNAINFTVCMNDFQNAYTDEFFVKDEDPPATGTEADWCDCSDLCELNRNNLFDNNSTESEAIVGGPDFGGFLDRLLGDSIINPDKDTIISQCELDDLSDIEVLNISFSNGHPVRGTHVIGMKGIEYFTGLKSFTATSNDIVSIDLKHNKELEVLDMFFNDLVTGDGVQTGLNGLDSLSELKTMRLLGNNLSTIDLSGLDSLQHLELQNQQNDLDGLDLSQLPVRSSIKKVWASGNAIPSLDLAISPALSNLELVEVQNNNISTLDFDGTLVSLKKLIVHSNPLTILELDLTSLAALEIVDFHGDASSLNRHETVNLSGLTNLKEAMFYASHTDSIKFSGTYNALVDIEIHSNEFDRAPDLHTNVSMPNLKEFWFRDNPNVIGHLDLSGFTKLQLVHANNVPGMTSIDLTNSDDIRSLRLGCSTISPGSLSGTLDLCKLSNLGVGTSQNPAVSVNDQNLTVVNLHATAYNNVVSASITVVPTYANEPTLFDNNCSMMRTLGMDKPESKLSIYPNPFTDSFSVTSNENILGIVVTNALGAIVEETSNNENVGAGLPKGTYTIKVITESGETAEQVIKN